MEEQQADVIVFDGICGSGKTTKTFDLINELTSNTSYGSKPDPKFIFVTPFMMECHRIAGSVPVEIPIEHAQDFNDYEISSKSEKDDINLEQRRDENDAVVYRTERPTQRRFILPRKNEHGRLGGIKDAVYHNKDIVITHAAFIRFDQELLVTLKQRDYQLIIDEVPQLFGDITDLTDSVTSTDVGNLLRSGNLMRGEDDVTFWKTTDEVKEWDAFKGLKKYVDQGRVINSESGLSALFLRFIPDYFKSFRSIHLLTYIFEGSICKSYFDLYGITYRVEKITRNHGDPAKYWELIIVHNTKSKEIDSLSKTALSSKWFKRKTTPNLKFLRSVTESFFNNTCREVDKQNKLWTTYKHAVIKTKGSGYTKQFLSITSRATNAYREVEAMAYLANIYPLTPIANYFGKKNLSIDSDKYALAEMIQWIFRSRIRDGKPIKIFIPSKRMRTILEEWMAELEKEHLNRE